MSDENEKQCTHVDQINPQVEKPDELVCPECEKIGATWVHLRQCLICGQVGCCESSEHQHAKAHFEETGHPLIQSIEPGEEWKWCYVDEIYLPEAA